jgi:hypothetical protein
MKRSNLIVIGLIIGICIAIGGFYLQQSAIFTAFLDNLRPKGEQIIDIRASPPKRADKLFTTFVYMPILDYKRTENSTVVQGLCSRQYEVGIGYEDVWKLFEQYQEAACKDDFQSMPNPTILSTNTVKSDIKGDYTQRECDAFDEDNSAGKRRNRVEILTKLGQDGQWQKIAENSRRVLTGYLRIYCSEPDNASIKQ